MHEIHMPSFNIPIVTFQVFNRNATFNMDICKDSLIGLNIPVKINQGELYKYDPSDEYYSENCTDGELSLYERKQEYNDNNLSLCQYNYNYNTQSVTCYCYPTQLNVGTLHKFELKEEEQYKCKIIPTYQKESDIIPYCSNVYEYFYEARACKINVTRANKDIIESYPNLHKPIYETYCGWQHILNVKEEESILKKLNMIVKIVIINVGV